MPAMLGHGGSFSRAAPSVSPFSFRSLAVICCFGGLSLVLVARYIPAPASWGSSGDVDVHMRAGSRALMGEIIGPYDSWDTPFGQNVTVQIQKPGQTIPPPQPTQGGFNRKEFLDGDTVLTQVGSKVDVYGNLLMLSGQDQATKALWKQPFTMVDGKQRFNPAFRTSFTLDIQAAACLGDGVAFVITSDKKPGQGGAGMGYGGANTNSVIVEFDTFLNPEVRDIDGNHVGININGNPVSVVQASFAGAYENVPSDENSNKGAGQNPVYLGQAPVSVWIEYRGSVLSIWASHGLIRPKQPVLSYPIDLHQYLQPQSYVGFTAASGACQLSVATISNWDFKAETYDDANPCLVAFQAGQVLCPNPNTKCNYEGPGRFSCS